MKSLSDRLTNSLTADIPPSRRRREVLRMAAGLAVSAVLTPVAWRNALAQPRFSSYPFPLCVASGSPRPDGIVLWTRLAPDPLAGGGMSRTNVQVDWELAADERFRTIVRTGKVQAVSTSGHSIHVELTGLEPARWYWYR